MEIHFRFVFDSHFFFLFTVSSNSIFYSANLTSVLFSISFDCHKKQFKNVFEASKMIDTQLHIVGVISGWLYDDLRLTF